MAKVLLAISVLAFVASPLLIVAEMPMAGASALGAGLCWLYAGLICLLGD